MSHGRHLIWENFRDTFIVPGVPAIHPLIHEGQTDVQIFVDAGADRIGLRVPVSAGGIQVGSPLASVEIRILAINATEVLELSTRTVALYQQFYALLVDVADRIQLAGRAPKVALAEALDDWRELLRAASALSIEAQTGLAGELWMVERLYKSQGTAALDAWVGPLGEPHDFRLGTIEIEVKTTRGLDRVHIVNGLEQLVPSPECKLFLLSLQLEPAGAGSGLSLPERITRIRALLAQNQEYARQFEVALRRTGYRDEDATRYLSRQQLRSAPLLIPVDASCPQLTPMHVRKILGPLSSRLRNVRYCIDVTGLGIADGTPEFLTVVP